MRDGAAICGDLPNVGFSASVMLLNLLENLSITMRCWVRLLRLNIGTFHAKLSACISNSFRIRNLSIVWQGVFKKLTFREVRDTLIGFALVDKMAVYVRIVVILVALKIDIFNIFKGYHSDL